jgi:hypothetical protein
MSQQSVEECLAALEAEVALTKPRTPETPTQTVPWWDQISGVFENDAHFDEAIHPGREWREGEASVPGRAATGLRRRPTGWSRAPAAHGSAGREGHEVKHDV